MDKGLPDQADGTARGGHFLTNIAKYQNDELISINPTYVLTYIPDCIRSSIIYSYVSIS